MATWYNTPTVSETPGIRTPVWDSGNLGNVIGSGIRNYRMSNIIRGTQRQPGESDEAYAIRRLAARNSVQQQPGETPEQYSERVKTAYTTANPTSDSSDETNPYSSTFDSQARNRAIAESGGTATTSPQKYGETPEQLNSRIETQVQASKDAAIKEWATKQGMTQRQAESPESLLSRQNAVEANIAPQQQQEPISSYYNRLSDALASLDPQKAMQYKQEAVKQNAIEQYQAKNKSLSASERIAGIGETMLPFSAAEGTSMITAGANLGLTQQSKAHEVLNNVAASFRGVTDKASYDKQRLNWITTNPQLTKFIPEDFSPSSLNTILTQGGLEGLVRPEHGSFAESELYRKQADVAQNAYSIYMQQHPTDDLKQASGLAKIATDAAKNYQNALTYTPAVAPTIPTPVAAPASSPAPVVAPVVAPVATPAKTKVVPPKMEMPLKIITLPKASGNTPAQVAQYEVAKTNYNTIMESRDKTRGVLRELTTYGDKSTNPYKLAEAQKTALENPTDDASIVSAFVSSEAQAASKQNPQSSVDQLISAGKTALLKRFGVNPGDVITAEQRAGMLESIRKQNTSQLATVQEAAANAINNTPDDVWASMYNLPNTPENVARIKQAQIDEFVEKVRPKPKGRAAMSSQMQSSSSMTPSSSSVSFKQGKRLN